MKKLYKKRIIIFIIGFIGTFMLITMTGTYISGLKAESWPWLFRMWHVVFSIVAGLCMMGLEEK